MIDEYMNEPLTNVAYAFLIGGLIIIFATVGTHNTAALSGTIAGYSATICAVLILCGITFVKIQTMNKSLATTLYSLSPFLILLTILAMSLAIVSVWFKDIADGHVTSMYTTFSYISVIFIFLQIWTYYSGSQGNMPISQLTSTKLLLLEIINIVILLTIGVNLKYYSTDG